MWILAFVVLLQSLSLSVCGSWVITSVSPDLLNYVERRPDFSYEEARNMCLKLKMLESSYPQWPSEDDTPIEEFWSPIGSPTTIPTYITNKYVGRFNAEEGHSTKKGYICSARLQGVMLVYRNGTVTYFNIGERYFPRYCIPQLHIDPAKLGVALCVLVHKKVEYEL